MVLENKLGITESSQLAREEERLSKKKAIQIFQDNLLNDKKAGTFLTLSYIHEILFSEIYDFAGKIRNVNIAKGNFRFAPVMFLDSAISHIDSMPQSTFDEIIEKYEGKDILITTHGGVTVVMGYYFRKIPLTELVDTKRVPGLKNCEIAEYEVI